MPKLCKTDSITTEQTTGILATYQAHHLPPLVTPANNQPAKTIIHQNQFNHIQRNIFFHPNSEYQYWPSNPHLQNNPFNLGHHQPQSRYANYDSGTTETLALSRTPNEVTKKIILMTLNKKARKIKGS
jgi:hypothetical protein